MKWTEEEIKILMANTTDDAVELTGRSKQACWSKKSKLLGKTPNAFERLCPVCGKVFYMYSAEWVYKIVRRGKPTPVCSWKCMRAKK